MSENPRNDPLTGECARCGKLWADHPGGFCPDGVGVDGMVAVGSAPEFEPKGDEHEDLPRYRIYALRRGDLAFLRGVDEFCLGESLIELAEAGKFDGASMGLLDRADPSLEGSWLINPYTKGA